MALTKKKTTFIDELSIVESGPRRPQDPLYDAVRLRPPTTEGSRERFLASDPSPALELTRIPLVARLVRSRRFQFFLILPNQLIFWSVIFLGVLGSADPGLNFATAITWYLWFCVVFVLMATMGRGWCAMCPFGGFGEWIQRHTFWTRTQKALGLGKKLPSRWAGYGFLISTGTFIVLTFLEEFFNIAGPGAPYLTSFMVLGIVGSATASFLIFERRTFCRYICPLSSLVGTVGSMGAVAGFRTKDREVCLSCETKDCMRGGADGFGCPWYTWPGSSDSNLYCGLCSECYKACPQDNVGLFLQPPLTSVIAPRRRRFDIAWAVTALWGLVLFQQINALSFFGRLDDWLNSHLNFPHYPNPIDFLGFIALFAIATAAVSWGIGQIFARRDLSFSGTGSFLGRTSRFRSFFMPVSYALIPVMGADYFARQLPKLFNHVTRLVPAIEHIFGLGSGADSSLYSLKLLSDPQIVMLQVGVIALGTVASAWAGWRIARRDLVPISRNALAVQATTVTFTLVCGAGAALLYVLMHAAE